jgi:DNA-binding winged helix-turn-helix (wHTH) protein/tetratricopeptide (TPR) repeat protein
MLLTSSELYRFDEFELQPSRRILTKDGVRVPLAPKTFEVLLCLVRNAGRVVLKEELFKTVWPDSFIEESNLTQHIFWLRKALGDKARYIVTIPGRGYEFAGPVHAVSEAARPTVQVRVQQTTEVTRVVVEEASVAPALLAAERPLRLRLGVAVAAAALVAFGLIGWARWRWLHRVVPGDHHEVVLADFENTTGDPDFDRALKTLLAIDLNQSPYLAVAGDADTRKVLALMNRSPDGALTPAVAREVCERMNDQAVLAGLIARFGQKYLVTIAASDCASGRDLVQTKAVADSREGVLKAVDTVAAEMRLRLGESLKSRASESPPLQLVHTFSLDALRAYSQAESLAVAGRRIESIPLYRRALELDPRFAAAWLHLAVVYRKLDENGQAREAAEKAYELRDQGDDFLRFNILSFYNEAVRGDMRAYLANLTAWTEMYPNQPQPWIDLANVERSFGHNDLAVQDARRAVALAPNNGNAYSVLCGSLEALDRPDEAKAVCLEAVRRKIDTPVVHMYLSYIALLQHDQAGWDAQNAWAKGKDDEGHYLMSPLFAQGKIRAAVALWMQIVERYRQQGLAERADRTFLILLRREADYGMNRELARDLKAVPAAKTSENLVIANAELGRIAAAESSLKALKASAGANTVDREYFWPQAEAAIALAQRKPEEAIALLEVARPFDSVSLEGMSVRARAYLAARQPTLAQAEFRKVLDHVSISPGSQSIPLAHLGLARAYEMQGNHAAARSEYETLFAIWKDADSDLSPLIEARAEYAKLP